MQKGFIVFKQLVLPVLLALMLSAVFRSVYMTNGTCDYFLAWILIGFPFGIRKMWFWLAPSRFDLGATIGIVFLNVLVGGLIGGLILIWQIIKGLCCTAMIFLRRT